jgi:hypothetical protein
MIFDLARTALLQRGYSPEEVNKAMKVMGGDWRLLIAERRRNKSGKTIGC